MGVFSYNQCYVSRTLIHLFLQMLKYVLPYKCNCIMISNTFNFLLTLKNRPIQWRTMQYVVRSYKLNSQNQIRSQKFTQATKWNIKPYMHHVRTKTYIFLIIIYNFIINALIGFIFLELCSCKITTPCLLQIFLNPCLMYSHGHQVHMHKILLISAEPCQPHPPHQEIHYTILQVIGLILTIV